MDKKDINQSNSRHHNHSCYDCNYFKKKMCVAHKPEVPNKPFGFPFKFNPREIHCHSWVKENIDKWVSWDHLS